MPLFPPAALLVTTNNKTFTYKGKELVTSSPPGKILACLVTLSTGTASPPYNGSLVDKTLRSLLRLLTTSTINPDSHILQHVVDTLTNRVLLVKEFVANDANAAYYNEGPPLATTCEILALVLPTCLPFLPTAALEHLSTIMYVYASRAANQDASTLAAVPFQHKLFQDKSRATQSDDIQHYSLFILRTVLSRHEPSDIKGATVSLLTALNTARHADAIVALSILLCQKQRLVSLVDSLFASPVNKLVLKQSSSSEVPLTTNLIVDVMRAARRVLKKPTTSHGTLPAMRLYNVVLAYVLAAPAKGGDWAGEPREQYVKSLREFVTTNYVLKPVFANLLAAFVHEDYKVLALGMNLFRNVGFEHSGRIRICELDLDNQERQDEKKM